MKIADQNITGNMPSLLIWKQPRKTQTYVHGGKEQIDIAETSLLQKPYLTKSNYSFCLKEISIFICFFLKFTCRYIRKEFCKFLLFCFCLMETRLRKMIFMLFLPSSFERYLVCVLFFFLLLLLRLTLSWATTF